MSYSIDIINLAITKFNILFNLSKVAKLIEVSLRTIYNWYYKYNSFFQNNIHITNEYLKNISVRKTNKINNYKDAINNYVNNNEGCSLNDLYEHINKDISKPSICKILKLNGISRKRIINRIVCKDINKIKQDRINFKEHIINNNINYNTIYALDECSFCINDYNNYGYSKKNNKIIKIIKHKRTKETKSIIMCINSNNSKDYNIIEKTNTGETFLDFIKSIKDKLINNTLLLDNARIHHYKKFKKYCEDNNIRLLYLPAYTPEFNPIEILFSQIKSTFRQLDHSNLKDAIIKSINSINTNFINLYNKCYNNIIN